MQKKMKQTWKANDGWKCFWGSSVRGFKETERRLSGFPLRETSRVKMTWHKISKLRFKMIFVEMSRSDQIVWNLNIWHFES